MKRTTDMRLLTTVVTAIKKRRAELHAEDTQLAKALQALAGNPTPATIPARRRMNKAQREAVSVRMKAYWRKRRQTAKGGK